MAATTLTRASAVTPDTKRLRVPREFIDACDVLSLKPSYLFALTASMIGDGFEGFSSMGDDLQRDLLSLVCDLAREVNEASQVINRFILSEAE